MPELLGEDAVGRKQSQHEYLYWEIGKWKAVRMGDWKAVLPKSAQPWELYDLRKDISEANNIAANNKEILDKLTAFALEASEPARIGTFHNPEIHQRDRRAKFGKE